jgi:hypothetical protein
MPPHPGGQFSCDVLRAGPDYNGNVNIRLQDRRQPQVFGPTWFVADASVKQEMLAVALAAMSTNTPVDANLVSTDQYSTILWLYIDLE